MLWGARRSARWRRVQRIARLSTLLAFTTPLTLLTSSFGMNVYPLNEVRIDRGESSYAPLLWVLGGMATITILSIVLACCFERRR